MSRALILTEKQARTLIRAADKERAVVEVKVGDVVFRLIPADLAHLDRPIDEERVIDL
jgi:hypothetical protein